MKSRYAMSESEARAKRILSKATFMQKEVVWRVKAAQYAASHGQVACPMMLAETTKLLEDGIEFLVSNSQKLSNTLSVSVEQQARICCHLRQLEQELLVYSSMQGSLQEELARDMEEDI